jgi:hypothetical protein
MAESGTDFLTKKIGPLPTWAWMGAGLGVAWYYSTKNGSSSSGGSKQQQQLQQEQEQLADEQAQLNAQSEVAGYGYQNPPSLTQGSSYGTDYSGGPGGGAITYDVTNTYSGSGGRNWQGGQRMGRNWTPPAVPSSSPGGMPSAHNPVSTPHRRSRGAGMPVQHGPGQPHQPHQMKRGGDQTGQNWPQGGGQQGSMNYGQGWGGTGGQGMAAGNGGWNGQGGMGGQGMSGGGGWQGSSGGWQATDNNGNQGRGGRR